MRARRSSRSASEVSKCERPNRRRVGGPLGHGRHVELPSSEVDDATQPARSHPASRPWKTLARPVGSRYRRAGSFSGSTIPYRPTRANPVEQLKMAEARIGPGEMQRQCFRRPTHFYERKNCSFATSHHQKERRRSTATSNCTVIPPSLSAARGGSVMVGGYSGIGSGTISRETGAEGC